MFTRPKTGETEEDLLQFQEEFLANRINPAALAVRTGDTKRRHEPTRDVVVLEDKPSGPTPPPVKKSKFREGRQKQKVGFEDDDPEDLLEKHDQHITKVLSEIVERENKDFLIQQPSQFHGSQHKGFPSVFHLKGQQPQGSIPSGGGKKKSLFAQQISRMSKKDLGVRDTPSTKKKTVESREVISMDTESSAVIEGIGLAAERGSGIEEGSRIHEENKAKLGEMSEEEILEEQKKLLEMLDPNVVEFLKAKKKSSPPVSSTTPASSVGMQIVEETKQKPVLEDLPVKPNKTWVNMDKIEYEKLEWMKDLPKPTADSGKGQQARFDFQGKVIAQGAALPVHLGLHHHGDEPERAGYTLEEIFTLCRSTVSQQRVLALQVLTKILTNTKEGAFTQCLLKPLIPTLLDSGVVYLLRWALDDSLDPVQHAAVHAVHALVFSNNDQIGLDTVFSWYRGYEVAMMSPMVEEEVSEVVDEKLEKTDAEVIKQDLIKGLFQMSLLDRLRYILEVCKPPAPVVIHALEIIMRVAQHSPEAAYQVYQCPRLLETIFREFLPTMWEAEAAEQVSSAYGHPLSSAMKLMRVICQAGRNMTALLISKYGLMEIITRFMSVQPSDLGLPVLEAYQLWTESCRTWSVILRYGLSADNFNNFYPVLMKTFMHIHARLLVPECEEHEQKRAVALIGLLEGAMLSAAAGTSLMQKQSSDESRSAPLPCAIQWKSVMGVLQPIELCANKHMQHFIEHYEEKRQDPGVLTACLHFMASYYSKVQNQPEYNAVECCTYMETMSTSLLLPLLKSTPFRIILTTFRKHSNLLDTESVPLKETPSSLPGVGSTVQPSDPSQVDPEEKIECCCPVLRKGCPVDFITAVVRIIFYAGKLHQGISDQLYSRILENLEVMQYVRRICLCTSPPLAFDYFTKFENYLQYFLLKIATSKGQGDMKLLHQMSLQLFARLHQGDEHIGHDLISTVIFNNQLINRGDLDLLDIEHLKLSEVKKMGSATQDDINMSEKQLLQDATSHLASIRGTYLKTFGGMFTQLMKSRNRALHISHDIQNLMPSHVGEALTPTDWMFYPIIMLYQRTIKPDKGVSCDQVSPSDIGMIGDMLKWVFLLECLRPTVVDVVSITTRITRLLCCFISGSDLFLELPVHCYLCALLRKYSRPAKLKRMNFDEKIPGLLSFYDMFTYVLQQFEAVSFGDSLFSCFILLPMQQRHSIKFRKCVWSEYPAILRTLFIPIKELLLPLSNFMEPEETHLEMLRLYGQALLSGTVRRTWSPVMYTIALHHLNRFLYNQDTKHKQLQSMLFEQVVKSKNQVLKQHILYYKTYTEETDQGFTMYDTLPNNRQSVVDRYEAKS